MPLEIYKRGRVYWAKGWVEYNGRRIAGPYRRSTKASTEAGARDWVARETEAQIHRYVCQSASKRDPLSASKFDPLCAELARRCVALT